MGFIDYRCAQIEASDIRGLPDRSQEGTTVYLPPADLPRITGIMSYEQMCELVKSRPKHEQEAEFNRLQCLVENGILFLDELNRAQNDVLQSVFELVLDRKTGQYTLPGGWAVVAAGNFMEGTSYQVNSFCDAAFTNRFCHLIVSDGDTTLDEWAQYMMDNHGADAANIVEFASHNIKNLDGEVDGDLGFSIQPSRRSWEAVIRVEKAFRDNAARYGFNEEIRTQVIAGLVGQDMALAYTRYSCPVKWRDIMERGVEGMKKELTKLDRNQTIGLMWGLATGIREKIDEEKIANCALDFAEWLCSHSPEKDLVIAFCRSLISQKHTVGVVEAMSIVNRNVADLLKQFRQKNGEGKKGFVDYLYDRPELHALVSRTAWGKEDDQVEIKTEKKKATVKKQP